MRLLAAPLAATLLAPAASAAPRRVILYTIASFPRVEPNADVVVRVDGERFLELFPDRLTR